MSSLWECRVVAIRICGSVLIKVKGGDEHLVGEGKGFVCYCFN